MTKKAAIATIAIAGSLIIGGLVRARQADAHPLHTSLAEVTFDATSRDLRISIRVFVDDFTKASQAYAASKAGAARLNGRSVAETPMLMYARVSFVLADRAGHVVPLAACGGKRVGDLMWVCFHASAPSGPQGYHVLHRILFDLYADQINIVQATYGGKKVSMLFTHGDGFKRLD